MTTPTTEQDNYEERIRRPFITVPKTRWGKALFGTGLVVWFMLLMLPCLCFYIATVGTIRLGLSGAVDAETHPMLEINLLMSPEQRGFQMTRSSIVTNDSTQQCLETSVSYLLWQTDGTAANIRYCDCYVLDANATWQLSQTNAGQCEARP